MLTSRRVWLLFVPFFCMNFGWYFYITWLPTYLREARHVSLEKGALLAGLPLFFGGLGSLFSGLIATRAAEWLGNTTRARRALAVTWPSAPALMAAMCAPAAQPYPTIPTLNCFINLRCLTLAAAM
jgi:cyanate permease